MDFLGTSQTTIFRYLSSICIPPNTSSSTNQGPAERVPACQRVGACVPLRRRRRVSPPDAEGWREVLHRQAETTPAERAATFKPPRRRRIAEALRDRCLNCLSYSHRIARDRCLNCLPKRVACLCDACDAEGFNTLPETPSDCARRATTGLATALENAIVPAMRPSQTGIIPAGVLGRAPKAPGDAVTATPARRR